MVETSTSLAPRATPWKVTFAAVGFLGLGVAAGAGWYGSTIPDATRSGRWTSIALYVLLGATVCLIIAGRDYFTRQAIVEPEPSVELTGKIPCPRCRESVFPDATICPHCHQPIFAKTPIKNAQVQLTLTLAVIAVIGLVVWSLL